MTITPPEVTDVLVAGSGAGGLTAALTAAVAGAHVTLIERSEELGGTTAISGGRLWVPGNGRPGNDGDTADAARAYLTGLFDDRHSEMAEAFLTSVVPMTTFVEAHSPHRFAVCPRYPDYHPSKEGATLGGRCLDMQPLDTAGLTRLIRRVRRPPGYTPLTHAEWEAWRYPAAYDHALLAQRGQNGVHTNGVALVAALLHGAVTAGVQVCTGTRVTGLEEADDSRRYCASLTTAAGTRTISAHAVILATGGFDWNTPLRDELLPEPVTALGAAPSNTGDGLAIAQSLAAATANLTDGWWMPMLGIPGETVDGAPFYRGLVRERGAPRQIIVNADGHRFVDEAQPYNEIGKAMHRRNADGGYPNGRAYLVFDAGFHARYPLPGIPPGDPVPDWVPRADTVTGLATRLNVDPGGLHNTVSSWNKMCADGVDTELGRGANPYDRYYGDATVEPNPNMGPLDQPPYFAVHLRSGCVGTKGGPVTDTNGQIVDTRGAPVRNVFAVGNTTGFWTSDGYPGPGATLAIAMTFGYRAGRTAARLRAAW